MLKSPKFDAEFAKVCFWSSQSFNAKILCWSRQILVLKSPNFGPEVAKVFMLKFYAEVAVI